MGSAYAGKPQRGITMIEVLIAVVVLSIGLLGMAALQTQSVRLNHSAYLRSQATSLAYDMSDRMRVNRNNLGNYAHAMGAAPPAGTTVAATDVSAWLLALDRTLPLGQGSIAINGDTVTITVQWDDSRGTTPPEQFITVTQI